MDSITDVKQEDISSDELRFNDLFGEKDIANMSNETLDSFFNSVYKFIKKDNSAVYPHLDGIKEFV